LRAMSFTMLKITAPHAARARILPPPVEIRGFDEARAKSSRPQAGMTADTYDQFSRIYGVHPEDMLRVEHKIGQTYRLPQTISDPVMDRIFEVDDL